MISSLGKIREKMNRINFPNNANTGLENKILVGTHHKTGTVWMANIFKEISRKFGLKYFSGAQDKLPEKYDIFFQERSKFDLNKLNMKYNGLHLIRDPRDVIVSGCFYHQKSKEAWLHVKQKRLDDLSYQEKINSYNSLDDKILFEMEYAGEIGIGDMLSWDYSNTAFIEIKYEDLIFDTDLFQFKEIFSFLGFNAEIPEILKIAYKNSLFSGNLKRSHHIRSGRIRQWETYFKPKHKARFIELYGDALIRLGYEKDNEWANN